MAVLVRPTVDADRVELALTMCEADRVEMQHLQQTPEEALKPVEDSATYTVVRDGRVVALFGVVSVGTLGRVWMLSTDETKHCTSLARWARSFIKEEARKHGYLTNIVWSKNAEHLRWIDWLGFHFQSVEVHNSETFIRFGLLGEAK